MLKHLVYLAAPTTVSPLMHLIQKVVERCLPASPFAWTRSTRRLSMRQRRYFLIPIRRACMCSYGLGLTPPTLVENFPQALLEVVQLFLFQLDDGGQLRFNDVRLSLSRAPSATVDLEPQNAELFLRALLQPAIDEPVRREGEAAHATVTQELDAFTAAVAASAVSTTTGAPAAASTVVVVISSSVEETFPVPVKAKGSLLHKVCTSHTPMRILVLDSAPIGPMT